MDRHPLFEYRPHEFTAEEKRFLGMAGWATIPADDLVERAAAILDARPPEIEAVTFLTRGLLRQGLFAERRRAYAFAQSYLALVAAGTDFQLVVWDWE